MHRRSFTRLIIPLLIVLGLPCAISAQALPSISLPAELDRVLRDYERHWQTGDAVKLSQLFHPDGFALPSGQPHARGRAAIAQAYGKPDGALRLRAVAYHVEGSVGYVIGAYTYGDAGTADVGKFVLAVRKGADGTWLIAADMDNGIKR